MLQTHQLVAQVPAVHATGSLRIISRNSRLIPTRHPVLQVPQKLQPDGTQFLIRRKAYPVAQGASSAYEEGTAVERSKLAGGLLDVFAMPSGRTLRVWTPPGYDPSLGAVGPYPVAYLNDGQNLFDPKLTLSGSCWEAAETAAALIDSGQLPPFVIVGIDHAGDQRSFEYTPCVPGTGPGGVRKDARNWPGGGVDAYLDFVVKEVVPFICERYGTSRESSKMLFGGSSFGGICTLCMAMKYPRIFGSILVESPSLWIDNERWLEHHLETYRGNWPQYTFVGMGTAEYTGNHPEEPQLEFDQRLVKYVDRVAAVVKKQGGDKNVDTRVAECAAHTESAWADRLPHAMLFLCAHWKV